MMTAKKAIEAGRQVHTAFSVGDFVRLRRWTVEQSPKPLVERRVRRIVDTYDDGGRMLYVCGGGATFEAIELVPA